MPENLTIEELCTRWEVSRVTLAVWRMQNKGPSYIKVGRKILYPASAVEKYEKDNMQKTRGK